MSYAVHYPNSNMIARDAKGGYHIYPTKEKAETVAATLGEGHTVKPFEDNEE